MNFIHSYNVRINKDIWVDILKLKKINKIFSVNQFINESLIIGIKNKLYEYSKRKKVMETLKNIN